jgi:hypothetical protein
MNILKIRESSLQMKKSTEVLQPSMVILIREVNLQNLVENTLLKNMVGNYDLTLILVDKNN